MLVGAVCGGMATEPLVTSAARGAMDLGAHAEQGQPEKEKRSKPGAAAEADPRDRLQREFVEAWNARDMTTAEARLREWIALRPLEFVPVYNLASVLSVRGEGDEAAKVLEDAVMLGFSDRAVLERDPHLTAARRSARGRALLADWPGVLDRVIDARLAKVKAGAPKYETARDPAFRLAYASGFVPSSFETARQEIGRLVRWWEENVLPEGVKAVTTEGDDPDPWVLVLLPTPKDFQEWVAGRFARQGALSVVSGIYDHDRKELVSGDLGPSFRHEFLHVLHWRDNARMGQVHPIWVQEGLCSLVEDVKTDAEGRLTPLPSWRTNTIKRRASASKVSIEALLKLPREKFTGTQPLANYALARAVFLYLHDRGKLRAWYGAYRQGFEVDETGEKALVEALGKPMAEMEKDFRAWLRALPEVPDDSRPGAARLPMDMGLPAGDGVAIEAVGRGGGAGELIAGDVVLAIDGKPVRELQELARVLGEFKPGATVEVTYRRHKRVFATKVRLVGRE